LRKPAGNRAVFVQGRKRRENGVDPFWSWGPASSNAKTAETRGGGRVKNREKGSNPAVRNQNIPHKRPVRRPKNPTKKKTEKKKWTYNKKKKRDRRRGGEETCV